MDRDYCYTGAFDELIYDYVTGMHRSRDVTLGVESTKKDGSVRKVFEEVFKGVTVGPTLHARIVAYCKAILSRDGNVEWMGSNLLGTETIRFFTTDRDRFFDEVLEVDEDYLTELLHGTDLNMAWNVTSDTFNLTVTYLVHLYLPLIEKDKKAYEAIVELVSLLQFKFYSSIYSHFFKKPVDMPAAEGTYAALSLKFAIKQLGSWGAVLRERSEYFVSKESPHDSALRKFQETKYIIYFISDLNTRTKQTVKDYYSVLDSVRANNNRIGIQSAKVEIDGEAIIRDRVSAYTTARSYLLDSSTNVSSFYKNELVAVVLELVPKASASALRDLLTYTAQLPFGKEREKIERMMELTLEHAFEYVAVNRVRFTDTGTLLTKMRALYMSSKTSDSRILELRETLEAYAKKNTHLRNNAALSAIRNALMLYFLLRAVSSTMYD